jgi:hypothetical protein
MKKISGVLALSPTKDKTKRQNLLNSIIQYFHKYDKPILIGEISLFLHCSIETAEDLMLELENQTNPPIIKSLQNSSEKNSPVYYILNQKQSAKIAGDSK